MKFEDDVNRDTFEVECIEGDNSSVAVAEKWPTCKPGKGNLRLSRKQRTDEMTDAPFLVPGALISVELLKSYCPDFCV